MRIPRLDLSWLTGGSNTVTVRMASNERTPTVDTKGTPPEGDTAAVKGTSWGDMLRLDNENPDEAVQHFGLDYLEKQEVKDAHLRNCLRIRKVAVTSRKLVVNPASEEPEDIKIAEFVQWNLDTINGNIKRDLRETMDAVGKGYTIQEIIWEPITNGKYKGRFRIAELRHKPPDRFRFNTDRFGRLKERDGFVCIQDDGAEDGLDIEKFLIWTFDSKYENYYGRGLTSTCSWYAWFKKNGAKFWLIFLEKFGSPTPKATVPPGATPEDKKRVKTILATFQQQTGIMVPEGFDIALLEASRQGSQEGYHLLLEWCDKQISLAVLGQTLTSDVGAGGGGAYALGKIHNLIKENIVEGDVVELEEAYGEQFIKRLVDYNFDVEFYPTVTILPPETPGELTPEMLKIGLQAGVEIGKDWFRSHFSIPKPEEADDILERPEDATAEAMALYQEARAW